MPLLEEFETSGDWLFRWRSYIPLAMLALLLSGLGYFDYPFHSHAMDELWEILCLAISFAGLLVRALTIGSAAARTSGRNTKEQKADALNTSGMYSIVRNPLYFGNFLIVLGLTVFFRVWWIPLIYSLSFMLYYERIIFAEEKFLRGKFGQAYVDWASRTPAFIPRLSQWRNPDIPFSWNKVLRREYHGVAGVVLAMFTLEVAGDLHKGEGFELDFFWAVILTVTIVTYVVLRILHKHTALLRERKRETKPRVPRTSYTR